jgi:hypothetical protein
VTGAGAAGWQRGDTTTCVEVGRDPEQTLIAQVRIEGDWLLRPLHNCQNRTRCGYVEISVSTASGAVLVTETAAALSVNLPLAGVPLTDGESLTFTARLMDQYGRAYVVADGGLCGREDSCSTTLSVAQHCEGSTPEPDGGLPVPSDGGEPADAMTPDPEDATSAIDGAVSDAASLADASAPDAGPTDAGISDPADGAALDATADASDAADAG